MFASEEMNFKEMYTKIKHKRTIEPQKKGWLFNHTTRRYVKTDHDCFAKVVYAIECGIPEFKDHIKLMERRLKVMLDDIWSPFFFNGDVRNRLDCLITELKDKIDVVEKRLDKFYFSPKGCRMLVSAKVAYAIECGIPEFKDHIKLMERRQKVMFDELMWSPFIYEETKLVVKDLMKASEDDLYIIENRLEMICFAFESLRNWNQGCKERTSLTRATELIRFQEQEYLRRKIEVENMKRIRISPRGDNWLSFSKHFYWTFEREREHTMHMLKRKENKDWYFYSLMRLLEGNSVIFGDLIHLRLTKRTKDEISKCKENIDNEYRQLQHEKGFYNNTLVRHLEQLFWTNAIRSNRKEKTDCIGLFQGHWVGNFYNPRMTKRTEEEISNCKENIDNEYRQPQHEKGFYNSITPAVNALALILMMFLLSDLHRYLKKNRSFDESMKKQKDIFWSVEMFIKFKNTPSWSARKIVNDIYIGKKRLVKIIF